MGGPIIVSASGGVSMGAPIIVSAGLGGEAAAAAGAALGAAEGSAAAMALKSAYEIAEAGGKHAGMLQQFLSRSSAEIMKSIASMEANAAEHIFKGQNAGLYYANWAQMTARHQQNQLDKWAKEVQTFQQQAAILRQILENRLHGGGQ